MSSSSQPAGGFHIASDGGTARGATWIKGLQVLVAVYLAVSVAGLHSRLAPRVIRLLGARPRYSFELDRPYAVEIVGEAAVLALPWLLLLCLRFLERRRAARKGEPAPDWIVTRRLFVWLTVGAALQTAASVLFGRFALGLLAVAAAAWLKLFEGGAFSPGFVFIWGVLPLLLLFAAALPWRRPPETGGRARRALAGIAMALLAFAWAAMAGTFVVERVPAVAFYYGYGALAAAIPFVLAARRGWRAIGPLALLLAIALPAVSVVHVVPEIEKEFPVVKAPEAEEDDRLADKQPAFDPAFTRPIAVERSGTEALINESDAVVELNAARLEKREQGPTERIYPTFRQAVRAARKLDAMLLPSVEMADAYAKHLDDRFLQAIELHLHAGSSIYPGGKQGFLTALLARLLALPADEARDEAAGFLAAAIELGGGRVEAGMAVGERAKAFRTRFEQNADVARPIGFYAENAELARIFRRDRFLQRPFVERPSAEATGFVAGTSLRPAVRLAQALESDGTLRTAYSRFRRLAERLCNPEANLNLDDLLEFRPLFGDPPALSAALLKSAAWAQAERRGNRSQLGVAFWPFATSKEAQLFDKLYGGSARLPSTELMGDLVAAIRDGRVDLAPAPDSGWYDHQLHALETLLLPDRALEASKLLLRAEYKKTLRRAFAAMMTKRRETHVRNLFAPVTLGVVIQDETASPRLSVQPCATAYLRIARSYRFLAGDLRAAFGETALREIRVRDRPGDLDAELDEAAALFYGLYLTVCDDLGLRPALKPDEIPARVAESLDGLDLVLQESFFSLLGIQRGDLETRRLWYGAWNKAREWLSQVEDAPFLAEDQRVIVPVLGDASRTSYRYWSVIGVRLAKIEASYAVPPRLVGEERHLALLDRDNKWRRQNGFLDWKAREYLLPVNVFEEITLGRRPPTREEFRARCNQGRTREEILEAVRRGSSSRRRIGLVLGALAALGVMAALGVVARRALRKRAATR